MKIKSLFTSLFGIISLVLFIVVQYDWNYSFSSDEAVPVTPLVLSFAVIVSFLAFSFLCGDSKVFLNFFTIFSVLIFVPSFAESFYESYSLPTIAQLLLILGQAYILPIVYILEYMQLASQHPFTEKNIMIYTVVMYLAFLVVYLAGKFVHKKFFCKDSDAERKEKPKTKGHLLLKILTALLPIIMFVLFCMLLENYSFAYGAKKSFPHLLYALIYLISFFLLAYLKRRNMGVFILLSTYFATVYAIVISSLICPLGFSGAFTYSLFLIFGIYFIPIENLSVWIGWNFSDILLMIFPLLIYVVFFVIWCDGEFNLRKLFGRRKR